MDAHPRARWPRPVPLIGDPTRAAERAADPSGWAFDEASVSALHAVIDARRDVRRYRPDPVPPEVLRRVLAAGHRAPSVGHSQPWRFVVVTEQATRDRAAVLADRERLRQADLLTPDRRARLLDLQLEGIREAPLGVVVACDRRAPAAGRARPRDLPRHRPVELRLRDPEHLARRPGRGPRARLGDAVPARRPRRAAAPARRRGDPRLALPGLAGRAAARAGARAARLVAAARRSTTSSSPSGGRATASRRRRCPIWPARRRRRSWPRGTPATTCSPPRTRSACSTARSTGCSRCPDPRRAPARWCWPAPTTPSRRSGSRPTRRRSPPTCSPRPRAGESLGAAAARRPGSRVEVRRAVPAGRAGRPAARRRA